MAKPQLQIRPHELREARLRKVLSRPQVAKMAGISLARLEQLEVGERPGVSTDTVVALARVLEVEPTAISVVVREEASAS